ncbi:hypothetical protein [Crenobacter caeni]|uniref:Uncharacterized protein n=1 Tax=Crenobacter caeni TaxID=2705474 RepID=A0A6B2KUC4_9NEIS|nr:hypothetical protein [Crenobacter caeni]NDV13704.1 hypothetical protein [Crenobacter caeni]
MRRALLSLLFAASCAATAAPVEQAGLRLVTQSADGGTRLVLSKTAPLPDALVERLKVLPELLGEEGYRTEPLHGGAPVFETAGRVTPIKGFAYVQRALLSGDGRYALLGAGEGGSLDAWRIGLDGKREQLLPRGAAAFSGVIDASADGNTVAGWLLAKADAVPQGFVWQAGQGYRLLPAPLWLPYAVSADGRRVFASSRPPDANTLARQGLMRSLQGPSEGDWGDALAVSHDAKSAVGYYFVRQKSGNPDAIGSYRGWWWQAGTGYRHSARALYLDESEMDDPARFAAFRGQLLALAGLASDTTETVASGVAQWRIGEDARELVADARPVLFAREGALAAWKVWQDEAWRITLAHGDETIAAETLGGPAFGQVFAVRASADGRALQMAGEEGKVRLRRAGNKFDLPSGLHLLGAFTPSGRYYLWPDGEGFENRHVSWINLQDGERGALAACPLADGHYSALALQVGDGGKTVALGGEAGYCVYRTGFKDDAR